MSIQRKLATANSEIAKIEKFFKKSGFSETGEIFAAIMITLRPHLEHIKACCAKNSFSAKDKKLTAAIDAIESAMYPLEEMCSLDRMLEEAGRVAKKIGARAAEDQRHDIPNLVTSLGGYLTALQEGVQAKIAPPATRRNR